MKKLVLEYEHPLQGKFTLHKLNLLLTFQVNCPGCFSYALPLFNKLLEEYPKEEVSFLALSTAFEDFDKNTLANTKNLVHTGKLVGETKKFLNQHGIDKLPYPLTFPIAMDKMTSVENIDLTKAIQVICNGNPNYNLWPDFEKKALEKRVERYLKSLDKIAVTFTLNQFRGTPTFVLFNDSYEILKEWFGHVSYVEINNYIQSKL